MKFVKRPIEIEAMQLTGSNGKAVCEWAGSPQVRFEKRGPELYDHVDVDTPEGRMTAKPGDWVIRGIRGEFYPCRKDIFEATYETVVDSPPAGATSDTPDGGPAGGDGEPSDGAGTTGG